MNKHLLKQVLGPGILLAVVTPLVISGLSTYAAVPGSACNVSFSGNLATLKMVPAGDWKLTSSNCSVTSQVNGMSTGYFTGTFTSGIIGGRVSGTWSLGGGTEKVTASNTDFTFSITDAQFLSVGSNLQGMLTATGNPPLLVSATVGQVKIG